MINFLGVIQSVKSSDFPVTGYLEDPRTTFKWLKLIGKLQLNTKRGSQVNTDFH